MRVRTKYPIGVAVCRRASFFLSLVRFSSDDRKAAEQQTLFDNFDAISAISFTRTTAVHAIVRNSREILFERIATGYANASVAGIYTRDTLCDTDRRSNTNHVFAIHPFSYRVPLPSVKGVSMYRSSISKENTLRSIVLIAMY